MKNTPIFCYVLAHLLISCGQVRSQESLMTKGSIAIDGQNRTYLYYSPQENSVKKSPLVILLHGGGGQARGIIALTKFDKLAEKEAFTLIAPDGLDKNWNDGRIAPGKSAYVKNIDDLGFIEKLIDLFIKNKNVDPLRVFVTGISNGGMMSLYLAQHLSHKIRAIAPLTASIPVNLAANYQPKQALSMLVINGTADKLVKYEGGAVVSEKKQRGSVISTDDMLQIWVKNNRCESKPSIEKLPDKEKADGCKAEKISYNCSQSGTELVLIKIIEGGHTWPGAAQYAPKLIVGNVCRDFNATELIWEFFIRQKGKE